MNKDFNAILKVALQQYHSTSTPLRVENSRAICSLFCEFILPAYFEFSGVHHYIHKDPGGMGLGEGGNRGT